MMDVCSAVYGELATMIGTRDTLNSTIELVDLQTADPSTAYYTGLFRALSTITGLTVADSVNYVVLPLYTVALPFLYMHMLAQRRKVLGGGSNKSAGSEKQKRD